MVNTNYLIKPINLLVITGPTASGKTGFAARLGHLIDGEIISADSRQVYRGMNLGTGKDYDDYTVGDSKIPYHLIDITDPESPYNVYAYQNDFIKAFTDISNRKKVPILCGGTGLYIEAVLKGYKLIEVPPDKDFRKSVENKTDDELIRELQAIQELHNTSDTDNRKRLIRALEIARFYKENPPQELPYPKLQYKIIGIKYDRKTERARITQRLEQRLQQGLVEEVAQLVEQYGMEKMEYFGLEYKFIGWYIEGRIGKDEMFRLLNTAIHQFAKRQMTWFRRMERNGFDINWIDGELPEEAKIELALKWIHGSMRK